MKNGLRIKSFVAFVIAMMIVTVSTMATAATGGNYSVGMSLTSSSKLKEGDTVTVSVNLTSVNAGNGIDTIAASIDYDTSVFEAISTANLSMTNEWAPSFSATSKMLTLIKNSKVTAPEVVLTMNFKVKSTISVDSTKITLKNIIASGGRVVDNGTGDITVSNATITISKDKDASSSTEDPKPTNNTTTGGNTTGSGTTGNTTKTNTSTTTKRDNTATKSSSLPKAGMEEYIPIAIVVISLGAIFSYALYRKLAKSFKY